MFGLMVDCLLKEINEEKAVEYSNGSHFCSQTLFLQPDHQSTVNLGCLCDHRCVGSLQTSAYPVLLYICKYRRLIGKLERLVGALAACL